MAKGGQLRSATTLLFVVAAIFGAPAIGQDIKECIPIKDNAKRLACFDRVTRSETSRKSAEPKVAAPAAKTLAPLELKGVRPAMTMKDVEALYPDFSKNCSNQSTATGVIICMHSLPEGRYATSSYGKEREEKYPELKSFAGQRIKYFAVSMRGELIESARVSLPNSAWLLVTTALREKFGPPAATETGTVQNRAGATFEQEELTWRDADIYLTAKKRGSDIDTMAIELRSLETDRSAVEAVKSKAKEGAKDL